MEIKVPNAKGLTFWFAGLRVTRTKAGTAHSSRPHLLMLFSKDFVLSQLQALSLVLTLYGTLLQD